MWLLSTDRAELRAFVSPNTVPDGYAILSHVWDAEEQTFKDVRKLGKKCARRGENPRDFVCEKIRRCCQLAEQHGYKWVWIDTCCIDKSSSSELSEAINSMFYYYSLASICYAYLRDVPTGTSAAPFSVKFMDSMWHKRGWTLQELLAPRLVLFVSSSWNIIGSKVDMAEDLEDITDIPSAVLKHEQSLSDINIAQRMWWAAERQTTRAEDEAYCLLGIFGITMPTLYGEGRQAFQRLQEEIMKRSPDTTLFAWGPRCGIGALRGYSSHCNSGILAIPPSQFRCSSGIIYKPELANLHANLREKVIEQADDQQIMSFSITPYGVLARIRVIQMDGLVFADMCWCSGVDRYWLILAPHRDNPHPFVPLYDIGGVERRHSDLVRLIKLHESDEFYCQGQVEASWKDVYLTLHSPSEQPRFTIPLNSSLLSPIHIPEPHIAALRDDLDAVLVAIRNAQLPWTGSPPTEIVLHPVAFTSAIVVRVGRCFDPQHRAPSVTAANTLHIWAHIQRERGGYPQPLISHAHEHHIATWPEVRKRFDVNMSLNPGARADYPSLRFTMSFTRSLLCHTDTLVMDIRFDGLYEPQSPTQLIEAGDGEHRVQSGSS